MSLSFDEACSAMEEAIWCEAWRADFERSAALLFAEDLRVATGAALADQCARYGFRDAVTRTIVEQRESFDEPRIRRLGAHVQWLQAERYTPRGYLALGWPPPPPGCPLLYVYAALGVTSRTEARHAALGIDPEITNATLWDIGQQVALHQEIHGEPGMRKGFWITHHLASHLFRLGRLQHQRSRVAHPRGPLREGDAVIDLHIPEDGRLSPESCDASTSRAVDFFARYFPSDEARWFTCNSWLLDPQLATLLPPESNIVQFQRRFERPSEEGPGSSGSVFEFVFHRPDLDPAESPDIPGLPCRTPLERAIVEHYRGGGRIYATFGWMPVVRAVQ